MADQRSALNYEFYSQTRWDNWIDQVRNSDFTLDSQENAEKNAAVFVNMADDVILACLKIVARYDKEAIGREEALDIFNEIRDIVLAEVPAISEDADIMICSVQEALSCSLAAFEAYFMGDYDKKTDFAGLIEEAFRAEEADDCELAFGIMAAVGAAVIDGQTIDDSLLTEIPENRLETFVASWLDGVDSISAAMVGSDGYKNFDEVDDGESV